MSKISTDEVRHVALLSRLAMSEDEVQRYAGDLTRILDYVEQLQEVNTEGVEPMAHALKLVNVFGPDAASPSLSNQAALSNAPEAESGCFKVPKVIQQVT